MVFARLLLTFRKYLSFLRTWLFFYKLVCVSLTAIFLFFRCWIGILVRPFDVSFFHLFCLADVSSIRVQFVKQSYMLSSFLDGIAKPSNDLGMWQVSLGPDQLYQFMPMPKLKMLSNGTEGLHKNRELVGILLFVSCNSGTNDFCFDEFWKMFFRFDMFFGPRAFTEAYTNSF